MNGYDTWLIVIILETIMMTQESPAIPTEIFESILYYSSYSTLLATSAVNGTFHHITRKYLFNFISLKRTVHDLDTVSRARTFLSLLDDIPDIADCVRRIHIDCFGESLLELSDDIVPDTKSLITILSRLTKLNSISLRGRDSTISSHTWLNWKAVCAELKRAFARTFRSPLVYDIKISHVYNLSLSIFVGCHSLKHLSFNVVSSRKSIPSQSDLQLRPKLRSLILRYSFLNEHDEENLKWLVSPQGPLDISQLHKFIFSGEDDDDLVQAAYILLLCAESIKSLELRVASVRGISSVITLNTSSPLPHSPIDLDILSKLTKLIVVAKLRTIDEGYIEEDVGESIEEGADREAVGKSIEEDADEDMEEDTEEDTEEDIKPRQPRQSRPFSYSSPLPWLAARLEMLTPASNLTEIVLQLNLSITDTILENIDWADLTRILLSKSLPSLNLVTLKVSGEYTPLSPVQWAVLKSNQHLSPLVERGRLVLVNSSP